MKYTVKNFVPRNRRILVEQPPVVKKIGGLFLPDTSQFRPNTGKIVAIDPMIKEAIENGGAGETFQVGDNVLFHKDVGIAINLNGVDQRLLHVNEVLGTYDENEAPEQ